MFWLWPLIWQDSGRYITKDRCIEMLHILKHILEVKIQIKIFCVCF